jgi:hypothetical protein
LIDASRDLATLLANMHPTLSDEIFIFFHSIDPAALQGISPRCTFEEKEGLSVIVSLVDAESIGLPTAHRFKMITLTVHSDLQAIGFLAAVATRLAEQGIACNAVSAFHHDYLFVPELHGDAAVAQLDAFMKSNQH